MAQRAVYYLPLAFLLLGVFAAVQVMLPQVMRLAIDGPLGPHTVQSKEARWVEIHELGGLIVGLLLVGFVSNYFSTWLLQKFGQNLILELRRTLFSKLHRLPIAYYDKQALGRIVSRVVNDTNSLSELFTQVLAAGLGDIIMLVGILVVLLLTDPVLSVILALFCPILVWLVFWFRNRSAPLYKVQRSILARINAYFSELLEGLPTVKSFQADDFQRTRFAEMNDQALDNEIDLLTLVARFRPGFAVAKMAASAALLTAGGWFVIEGSSTIGTLVSSLLYISLLFSPLEQLAERYNILIRAVVASERVLAILDLAEEPKAEGLPKGGETIAFKNVQYHYAPDKPVLRDINFEVGPGESVALVGPTGSGKSTIISLIMGFYPLDTEKGHRGEIRVGQQSLEDLNLSAWRSRIAFVSQDLFLFKGSVAGNVRLYEELDDASVSSASDVA